MKELIACCGLDCEKCDARIATVTACVVQQKKFAACGDCSEVNSCQTLAMVTGSNADALANLKSKL